MFATYSKELPNPKSACNPEVKMVFTGVFCSATNHGSSLCLTLLGIFFQELFDIVCGYIYDFPRLHPWIIICR